VIESFPLLLLHSRSSSGIPVREEFGECAARRSFRSCWEKKLGI
jgi:hypothetical protein